MRIVIPARLLKKLPREVGADGDLHGVVHPAEGHLHVAELVRAGRQIESSLPKVGTWAVCSRARSEEAEPGSGLRLVIGVDDRTYRVSLDGNDVTAATRVVDDEEEFAARIKSSVDVKHLSKCRVAILGAGRVGSNAAMLLAGSHVGRFTVLDRDEVEASNIPHSAFQMTDVGRDKAAALRDGLLTVNPLLEVTAVQADVCQMPLDALNRLSQGHDILLVAVDDPLFMRRVNDLAYALKPAVYVALHEGGRGEVVYTRPQKTRCLRCCVRLEERTRLEGAASLGIETLPVVLVAVQVVLGLLLQGRKGGDAFSGLVNDRRNLLLVGSRRAEPLKELPEAVLMATVAVDTSRQTRHCEVCKNIAW